MKKAVWLIIIGIVLSLVATWMKITHQPHADLAFGIALVVLCGGIGLLLFSGFRNQP